MTNLEKYNQVFMEHFEISAEELPGLKYRSYAKWDSMAHMELCSILEETFDIMPHIYNINDLENGIIKEVFK